MNPLGFPNWKITAEEHAEGATRYTAEYTPLPSACPRCGHVEPRLYRHETRPQLFIDTPMHGKRVGILLLRRRFKCLECGDTFFEQPPELDSDHLMTRRLVAYIQRQVMRRPFTHVADEIGVHERTIRNVFRAYVAELDKQHVVRTPAWLGIDELHLANRARCVFTDVQNRRLVGLEADRNKTTVQRFLSRLPGRDKVEIVTIDMWPAYRDAARGLLSQAVVVVDKFHVIRYANDAVEKVRKGLKEELTPTRRKGLKRDRYVLLKRPKDLDDKDQLVLDAWLGSFPQLKAAYDLKEGFYKVWEASDRQNAEQQYEAWRRSIPDELAPTFKDLTTAMKNWRGEIFAYFDHPVTNAYTEAMNGLIRVTNRMGRGYTFEAIRAKMLYEHESGADRGSFSYRGTFSERNVVDWRSLRERPSVLDNLIWHFGTDLSTLTERISSGRFWPDSTNYAE